MLFNVQLKNAIYHFKFIFIKGVFFTEKSKMPKRFKRLGRKHSVFNKGKDGEPKSAALGLPGFALGSRCSGDLAIKIFELFGKICNQMSRNKNNENQN